jgi:hypothetical protein
VTLTASDITPQPVHAARAGAYLLLRPVLRVHGDLLAFANGTAVVAAAAAGGSAKRVAKRHFDHYYEVPSSDPELASAASNGAGGADLVARLRAALFYIEQGTWAVSAELSLLVDSPSLVDFAQRGGGGGAADDAMTFATGANVTGAVLYRTTPLLQAARYDVQYGKTPMYLSRLELPRTLKVCVCCVLYVCCVRAPSAALL